MVSAAAATYLVEDYGMFADVEGVGNLMPLTSRPKISLMSF
jgi:hypothetical protein